MKQTCYARTRMLGPGIHFTGSDSSTCEDTFIVSVSFPPTIHKEQSRQSQDACSLSRCNEPVYATAWIQARNSQEAWPCLSADGCGHQMSSLNPCWMEMMTEHHADNSQPFN